MELSHIHSLSIHSSKNGTRDTSSNTSKIKRKKEGSSWPTTLPSDPRGTCLLQPLGFRAFEARLKTRDCSGSIAIPFFFFFFNHPAPFLFEPTCNHAFQFATLVSFAAASLAPASSLRARFQTGWKVGG
ncbi:hypothetical protein ACOMHN_043650 [Nucella lapillus]